MRKLFALIMILILLPLPLVAAEESSDLPVPAPTLTPEEWGNKKVPYARQPEDIDVVPMEELPPVVEGQHHYLLLCIDQWKRDPRPDNSKPPMLNGRRRDMYGNTDGIMLVTLDTRAHRIMLTSIIRDATWRQLANIIDYMGGVQVTLNTQDEIKKLRGVIWEGSVFDPNGNDLFDDGSHPTGVYTFKNPEDKVIDYQSTKIFAMLHAIFLNCKEEASANHEFDL